MLYEIERVLDALDLFQHQMDGEFSLSDFTKSELVDILQDMLNAMPCDFCDLPSNDELIQNYYYCDDCFSKTVECYVCELLIMPDEVVFDKEAMVSICEICDYRIKEDQYTI